MPLGLKGPGFGLGEGLGSVATGTRTRGAGLGLKEGLRRGGGFAGMVSIVYELSYGTEKRSILHPSSELEPNPAFNSLRGKLGHELSEERTGSEAKKQKKFESHRAFRSLGKGAGYCHVFFRALSSFLRTDRMRCLAR